MLSSCTVSSALTKGPVSVVRTLKQSTAAIHFFFIFFSLYNRFFICTYCTKPLARRLALNTIKSLLFHQLRGFHCDSLPPGTIHGTTPTPSGNTTGHSVADSHNSLVNTLSSSGSTKVSAMVSAPILQEHSVSDGSFPLRPL